MLAKARTLAMLCTVHLRQLCWLEKHGTVGHSFMFRVVPSNTCTKREEGPVSSQDPCEQFHSHKVPSAAETEATNNDRLLIAGSKACVLHMPAGPERQELTEE